MAKTKEPKIIYNGKDYAHIKEADMEQWCVENNELEWYVQQWEKKVERKIYPKKKKLDKNGNEVLDENGEVIYEKDTKATPEIELVTATVVDVKKAWAVKAGFSKGEEKKPALKGADKAAALRAKYGL